jgi:membrane protein YqaA with SNARE-associated domain
VSGFLEVAAAIGCGLASALLPISSAEAYAVVAGARDTVVVAVLGLAVGQTAGMLLFFEAARRRTGWLAARSAQPRTSRLAGRTARWSARLRNGLSHRRTGLPTVLVSAVVGIPPLTAVSLAAGTSAQRRYEFATACLLGRVIRFAVLALPVALA